MIRYQGKQGCVVISLVILSQPSISYQNLFIVVTRRYIYKSATELSLTYHRSETISSHHEPQRKFVFLGRAERRKGIIELNAVLKKLIADNKPFRFEFVGPIPPGNKIQHPSIIYHGEIRDTKKIKAILSRQDVLVCPSWSEGFPNVILEGMACGLAVIATNVGAVAAMVSDKNGWLIEPANKEQLEAALIHAIDSKELASKKENSLQLVRTTFNWDRIAKKTIEAIRN